MIHRPNLRKTFPSEAGTAFADLTLALGVVTLGLWLGIAGREIRFGVGYDRIGPRFFPYLVAVGLVLLGSWLAVAAIRKNRAGFAAAERARRHAPIQWPALGYLGLALLLNLFLLEPAGFVIAASAQFWLAARAFQSRRPGRDAVVAVLLSVLVYLAFTRGLGLTLPSGVLEGLL